ncbi:Multidrug/Oligosaccharidyl-lipid/Polysaccharide (MOP) Flippase Superfamily [Thraustotheca clavata]|uniref:Multidrug/Oligosaccharidyl-lipid/Polysaccharide (MOP) Flippase Superfamily n=1 Tax=Thraustotheca clavata TaxID=74557 RepID=A0A1V9ZZS4_9STRA|nr:Multidrug/Oligosaccharidyl-lipid/Polysaccharide (MOP) Flippase Superfamily [Thraustotheca clavata]
MEFLPGLVNIILVGQMNSSDTKEYVDAAANFAMYINITAYLLMGMASAMDTLCTQAFGACNLKKFGDYLPGAFLGMALIFAPVALLSWYAEPILIALGQDVKISMLAGTFTQLSLVGIPFVFVNEIVKKMIQAHSIVSPTALMVVVAIVIILALGIISFTILTMVLTEQLLHVQLAYCIAINDVGIFVVQSRT